MGEPVAGVRGGICDQDIRDCMMDRNSRKLRLSPWALAFGLLVGVGLIAGCGNPEREAPAVLRLATTTSTRDSGLIDELLSAFERQHQVSVRVIAVGTGKALKLGELGEVDVVLVHAEQAELRFLADRHAVRREPVMFNYFEILGPPDDPAGIRDQPPDTAFRLIRSAGGTFVSRGDDSGTHKREQTLWELAGQSPDWSGYLETGQGMGRSLIIADQKRGYILCDRGTYLAMKDKIDLVPLARKTESMKNPYGVLCVNPEKNSQINLPLANLWVDFLISSETQQRIGEFRIQGESLFQPMDLQ